MFNLFQQYSQLHYKLTEAEITFQLVYPQNEPSVCLVSADLFSFYGTIEEVEKAMEDAIANNQLLPNIGG